MNKTCFLFGHHWGLRTFRERELWENNLRPEQQRDWKCWRCEIMATDYQKGQEKPSVFKAGKFRYWIEKKHFYYFFKIKKFLKICDSNQDD